MISVRVPATTANLGPGFDCMGLALSLYGRFDFEERENGLFFENVEKAYQNEENLAVRGYRRALREMGEKQPGLFLRILSDIPVSRGLGSSASLITAGLTAANAAHGGKLDAQTLLELATELEGHPDNVAPALLGGLTVSLSENGRVISRKCPVSDRIGICALIPDFELSTAAARAVLPRQVPLKDAVFNVSHALVLLKALEDGDCAVLSRAMADRLHQPYRAALIPEGKEVRQIAAENGACGFCVSGAGPTLLCLYDRQDFPLRMALSVKGLKNSWQVLPLKADREGARVLTAEAD